jgi:DNA-directed RNA polymerase subunit M/transcription elongation factor TFIIS
MASGDKYFCKICNNVNILSTNTGELIYICSACSYQTTADPIDTLIRTDVIIKPEDRDSILIEFGRFDKCNPLEHKDCPKCKKTNYMRYIRDSETFKKIYLCPICDYTETTSNKS